jgi:hypothetical protein
MRQIPSCLRHLTERCCSMQKCATNFAHSLRKLCKLFGSLPGYGDKYIEILSSQKNNYRIVRAKGKVLKSFYRRGIFPKPEEKCSSSCFLLELNCCTTVASSLRFLAWFKQCWDMSRLAWGGGRGAVSWPPPGRQLGEDLILTLKNLLQRSQGSIPVHGNIHTVHMYRRMNIRT